MEWKTEWKSRIQNERIENGMEDRRRNGRIEDRRERKDRRQKRKKRENGKSQTAKAGLPYSIHGN